MVQSLERRRGGMVLFLERCIGGMVQALERRRGGMVLFLERRRVYGRVSESSRDVRGCVILSKLTWSGFTSSRDVGMIWPPREMSCDGALPRET